MTRRRSELSNDPHEPVTVTDKRRIDPETGEIREQASGAGPQRAGTGGRSGGASERAPTRSPN